MTRSKGGASKGNSTVSSPKAQHGGAGRGIKEEQYHTGHRRKQRSTARRIEGELLSNILNRKHQGVGQAIKRRADLFLDVY